MRHLFTRATPPRSSPAAILLLEISCRCIVCFCPSLFCSPVSGAVRPVLPKRSVQTSRPPHPTASPCHRPMTPPTPHTHPQSPSPRMPRLPAIVTRQPGSAFAIQPSGDPRSATLLLHRSSPRLPGRPASRRSFIPKARPMPAPFCAAFSSATPSSTTAMRLPARPCLAKLPQALGPRLLSPITVFATAKGTVVMQPCAPMCRRPWTPRCRARSALSLNATW